MNMQDLAGRVQAGHIDALHLVSLEGGIYVLEERINGCFRRSMNGKPLPPDSADMQAMVAYFDWMKLRISAISRSSSWAKPGMV